MAEEEKKQEETTSPSEEEKKETPKEEKHHGHHKEVEILKTTITDLEGQVANLKNEYAKAYADTENTRKRLQSEFDSAKKYRIQSFAMDILPVMDNCQRALAQPVTPETEGYHKGVQMIYDQLIAALAKEGVESMKLQKGDPFDANFHQAIITEKVEGMEEGKIVEVLQEGYMIKDRILRAAMVKVSE